MDLGEQDFRWAASEGLITQEQAETLWQAFSARPSSRPKFDFINVAYYFGALLVMGAMGLFVTIAWEALGGAGIFVIGSLYVAVFVLLGRWLWRQPTLKTPGGLCFTVAVSIVPLALYGFQRMTGMWPAEDPGTYHDFHVYVRSGWLFMELGTVIAGLITLRVVRFPFLTAPLAFIGWYMSMDLAPVFFTECGFTERAWVSVGVGAVMLAIGYVVDRRTREDFAYWMYLFGLLAFSGGLSCMHSGSQLGRFVYALIHASLILIGVLIERRVFVVFGGLGVFGYVGYLAWDVFKDSIAFPFVLSFLGVLVLFATVKYAKRREALDARVRELVPRWIRVRLPPERVKFR